MLTSASSKAPIQNSLWTDDLRKGLRVLVNGRERLTPTFCRNGTQNDTPYSVTAQITSKDWGFKKCCCSQRNHTVKEPTPLHSRGALWPMFDGNCCAQEKMRLRPSPCVFMPVYGKIPHELPPLVKHAQAQRLENISWPVCNVLLGNQPSTFSNR